MSPPHICHDAPPRYEGLSFPTPPSASAASEERNMDASELRTCRRPLKDPIASEPSVADHAEGPGHSICHIALTKVEPARASPQFNRDAAPATLSTHVAEACQPVAAHVEALWRRPGPLRHVIQAIWASSTLPRAFSVISDAPARSDSGLQRRLQVVRSFRRVHVLSWRSPHLLRGRSGKLSLHIGRRIMQM